jgi:hypothetical protein
LELHRLRWRLQLRQIPAEIAGVDRFTSHFTGKNIMNALRLIVTAALLAFALNCMAADAEKSDELKVFDRYIGTWDGQSAMTAPEQKTFTETSTDTWAIGGKYLQIKSTTKLDDTEAMHLITYDQQKQAYKYYWFNSAGLTFNSIGTWDEAKKTFTWDGTIEDGVTLKMTDHFLDEKTRDLHVVVKDRNGDTVFEVTVKFTKRKG